ncbi:MAG: hypothetical protein NDJ90_09140 [Oligoflexia bacterium]|nr:hypothetical protein [Oligoflexia bacterium]
MDYSSAEFSDAKIRSFLKVLLLHLAAKSETPSQDLQHLLREVLDELKEEVGSALRPRTHLKLVETSPDTEAPRPSFPAEGGLPSAGS